MNESQLREMLVEASLNLLPPRIRNSLLDDGQFLSKWQIKTTTGVTLNRGGPALTREDLYDALRRAIASEGVSATLKDKAGKAWSVLASKTDGRLRFSLSDGSQVFKISDHTALSGDRAQRLEWFSRAAAISNLPSADVARWMERLSGDPLTDDEFASLQLGFATTPSYVARELQQVIASGNADLESLVPASVEYYEQLVGSPLGAATAPEFVATALSEAIAGLLEWNPLEGMRQALLLGLGGQVSAKLDVGKLGEGEFTQLIEWLEAKGDPLSKVAGVELLLHRLEDFPQYEPHIERLARSIIADDPKGAGSAIALMSSLSALVGGEMARRRLASDKPPYWRRMAAFAHGSLLARTVIQTGLDTAEVTQWAKSQGIGHIFFLQGLIDLRAEPRWLPDFAGEQQMRAEFIGRMAIAADLNREKIRTDELRSEVLENEGLLRSAIRFPFAMLPGPLEGGLDSVQLMPEGVLEDIAAALATESLAATSFAGLVNSSLLYGVSPDLSALAADALRRVKYSIENDGDEAILFGLIGGLAAVSAVTRSADLANELRILTRVLRRRKRLVVDPEDELRIALIAAASRADLEQWATFAGEWISEIAFETSDKDKAGRLLMKVKRLAHLEPELAAPCAIADAALAGFCDWR